jgi:hypothetical protein
MVDNPLTLMNSRLNNAECGIMLPQAGRLGRRPSNVQSRKSAIRLYS